MNDNLRIVILAIVLCVGFLLYGLAMKMTWDKQEVKNKQFVENCEGTNGKFIDHCFIRECIRRTK